MIRRASLRVLERETLVAKSSRVRLLDSGRIRLETKQVQPWSVQEDQTSCHVSSSEEAKSLLTRLSFLLFARPSTFAEMVRVLDAGRC